MSERLPTPDELRELTRRQAEQLPQQARRIDELQAEVARLQAALGQALRPALVNRKVWGGNRTWRGAQAQGVLLSVLRTLGQRGADALTWLRQALCSATHVPLPSAR